MVLLDLVRGQEFVSFAQKRKGYFYSCLNTLENSVPREPVVANKEYSARNSKSYSIYRILCSRCGCKPMHSTCRNRVSNKGTVLFTDLLIACSDSYGNYTWCLLQIHLMVTKFIIMQYHLVTLFTFTIKCLGLQVGLFGCNVGEISTLNVCGLLHQKGAVRGSLHKHQDWKLPFFPRPLSFSSPWCILCRVLLWRSVLCPCKTENRVKQTKARLE